MIENLRPEVDEPAREWNSVGPGGSDPSLAGSTSGTYPERRSRLTLTSAVIAPWGQ